ncbi:MAG: ABC transporter ATP-binding protein [Deltaproteobacteria bacterium]|nr:ABC transporter ATP-binding protein [Deltaproteobacteria bacterium]
MITVRQVSKAFHKVAGHEVTAFQALEDITLEIRENEFVSLIGPSGCGKTTLLRIDDGLIPPDTGEVFVRGRRVTRPGPDRAVVFQSFALLPWRTVLANVEFSLELRGLPPAQRRERARRYIELVGLAEFEGHYPHELSGGMQQRVGIARALAVDPSVLLMDEPFGSVDAQTRQLLQEELLELWQRERKTVLFVTHSMDEAVYLSDRVVILSPRPGRVTESLEVPLPRPRLAQEVRRQREFIDLTNYIWESLRRSLTKHPPGEAS